MKKLGKIFNTKVRLFIGVILLISTIAFTQISQSGIICEAVVVSIENNLDNYFLEEQDILNLATDNGLTILEGKKIEQIDLKSIEKRLNDNPYIRYGQIYKDLQGTLIIAVELKRPIARILREMSSDSYITENGDQMPVSLNFTSRVVLISGQMLDTVHMSQNIVESHPEYFEMIEYIRNDDFWNMQISSIEIEREGELILIPQVTKQIIEFGHPDRLETKFNKLKIFYQEVLPREGWNKYRKVNVEFENQIIAE